jgi:hypothetical protein
MQNSSGPCQTHAQLDPSSHPKEARCEASTIVKQEQQSSSTHRTSSDNTPDALSSFTVAGRGGQRLRERTSQHMQLFVRVIQRVTLSWLPSVLPIDDKAVQPVCHKPHEQHQHINTPPYRLRCMWAHNRPSRAQTAATLCLACSTSGTMCAAW